MDDMPMKDKPLQSTETGAEKNTDNKRSNWIHWKIATSVFVGIGGFITVSLLVWQGAEWIRKSIDETVTAKLNDERVLRQIAAQVKPSVIFDAHESIISDMGAAQFIKSIHVTMGTNGQPEHIHIDLTRHFANAPVLTALYDSVGIWPERGKGLSWDYSISWIVQESIINDRNRVYRLELIP